jgi:NAD(P)-dependent dehydrogenase (short-subunit alcohol dehydrogenase family)
MAHRPVVLVTGAARRLGRAIALDLAAHGFDVALHHRAHADEARATLGELRAAGARAEEFAADLADEAACRGLVPAVLGRFGRLDAVVNNASLFEPDDVASFGHGAMEAHWRTNTAAPILLARALHTHVTARDGQGCVVNLLDQKLWNPNPDFLSYTLSKAALQAATVVLAQALGPRLRVCGVAPGVTLPSGDMTDAEFAAAHADEARATLGELRAAGARAEEFAAAHRMTPLQRSSTPQDVAQAVRYLLQAEAVTGTTLLVDGGQHLAAQPRDVVHLVRAASR